MNYQCTLELCYQSLINDPFASYELNIVPHVSIGEKFHISGSNFQEELENLIGTPLDWLQKQVAIKDIQHTFFPSQNIYSLRLALNIQNFEA